MENWKLRMVLTILFCACIPYSILGLSAYFAFTATTWLVRILSALCMIIFASISMFFTKNIIQSYYDEYDKNNNNKEEK